MTIAVEAEIYDFKINKIKKILLEYDFMILEFHN